VLQTTEDRASTMPAPNCAVLRCSSWSGTRLQRFSAPPLRPRSCGARRGMQWFAARSSARSQSCAAPAPAYAKR